jgi:hypothetical protein
MPRGETHWTRRRPAAAQEHIRKALAHKLDKAAAKVTPADVVEIRSRIALGAYQRTVADAFGITQSAVSCIVTGKTWKDIAPGRVIRRAG